MSSAPPGPGWMRSGMSLRAFVGSTSAAFSVAATTSVLRSATSTPDFSASSLMNAPYRTSTALYPPPGTFGLRVTSSNGEGWIKVSRMSGSSLLTTSTMCSYPLAKAWKALGSKGR